MSEAERPAGSSIREWYDRTTSKTRRGLVWATLVTIIAAILLWTFLPLSMIHEAQIFNGAMTIPAFGGLWIYAFLFIWLIPMREVSFRGHESLERQEERFRKALDEDIRPTILAWGRIGKSVETEFIPKVKVILSDSVRVLDEFRAIQAEIRLASQAVSEKMAKIEGELTKLSGQADPALKTAERVAIEVEKSIKGGILLKLEQAVEPLSLMGRPSGAPPSVEAGLRSLSKKPGAPASQAPPPPAPAPPPPTPAQESRISLATRPVPMEIPLTIANGSSRTP